MGSLPPEPWSTLTLLRSLWTLIGALASSDRDRSTSVRASAKTWLGVSQPRVAANVAEPRQHRQKPRRESKCWRAKLTVFSCIMPEIDPGACGLRNCSLKRRLISEPFAPHVNLPFDR